MVKERPTPPGEIMLRPQYPLSKAQDVLIAYAMNGEDLSPDHGYPFALSCPVTTEWLR